MKVGARKLRGKATTKKATKKVTKKAKAIMTVQTLRDGFKKGSKKNPLPHFKYLNCAISDIASEKFPEMVQITMGPTKIMEQVGNRRYVNETFAKMAIDEAHGFNIVDKGFTKVEAELADLGLLAVASIVNYTNGPEA